MKFHFAVFMGHEMIFMGFSHEIHGIFIKLQFIVFADDHVCICYTATMFLEFWKRRQAEIAYEWDLLGYEDEEVRY